MVDTEHSGEAGKQRMREKLIDLIDSEYFDIYQSTGLRYTDKMVENLVDKIMKIVAGG